MCVQSIVHAASLHSYTVHCSFPRKQSFHSSQTCSILFKKTIINYHHRLHLQLQCDELTKKTTLSEMKKRRRPRWQSGRTSSFAEAESACLAPNQPDRSAWRWDARAAVVVGLLRWLLRRTLPSKLEIRRSQLDLFLIGWSLELERINDSLQAKLRYTVTLLYNTISDGISIIQQKHTQPIIVDTPCVSPIHVKLTRPSKNPFGSGCCQVILDSLFTLHAHWLGHDTLHFTQPILDVAWKPGQRFKSMRFS